MKEDFLHFIWRFQYFDKSDLKTSDGRPLNILWPGRHNHQDGPDFSQGKIILGTMEWHGHIEIHLRSSDWLRHGHQGDASYDAVILHVVWEEDRALHYRDGKPMPTLVLKDRVAVSLRSNYLQLMAARQPNLHTSTLACGGAPQVSQGLKWNMLDRAMTLRLQRKSTVVLDRLHANGHDWEQTAYETMGHNFGFKSNSDAFLDLTRRVPFRLLAKYSGQALCIEALLFGQSGLLERKVGSADVYHRALRKEYGYLAHKHGLSSSTLSAEQWKFMRLRPANFPTLRIAQFAALLSERTLFFRAFLEADELHELTELLKAGPNDYWREHYLFSRSTPPRSAIMGRAGIENILINSVVPLLVAYARYYDAPLYREKAVRWLGEMSAEKNRVTQACKPLGLPMASAFDSQGALELFNSFCERKKCLSCGIGIALVKKDIVPTDVLPMRPLCENDLPLFEIECK